MVLTMEQIKWAVGELIAVRDDDNELLGFYSTVSDITAIKVGEFMQKERADEAQKRAVQQGVYAR